MTAVSVDNMRDDFRGSIIRDAMLCARFPKREDLHCDNIFLSNYKGTKKPLRSLIIVEGSKNVEQR